MSEHVFEVTDGNFKSEVIESVKPVLIDFWAPWCGPCKAVGPIVDELADEFENRMRFAKCNVDDNPSIPGKFGIRSIPTILFFKAGKVVEKITGAANRAKVNDAIQTVLSGGPSSQPFLVQ